MDELPLCGETVLTGEAFPFHPSAGILVAGWVYQPHSVPPRLCVDSYWVALTNLPMDFVNCPRVLPVLVTMFVCQTTGVTLKTRLESFTETCYLETVSEELLLAARTLDKIPFIFTRGLFLDQGVEVVEIKILHSDP